MLEQINCRYPIVKNDSRLLFDGIALLNMLGQLHELKGGAPFGRCALKDDGLAYVISTSGSTGPIPQINLIATNGTHPSMTCGMLKIMQTARDRLMVDTALETRLAEENWSEHLHRVNGSGFTVIENLLDPDVCQRLIHSYGESDIFRSCIDMSRHGFGSGQYKYFAYPLPSVIATLRASVYPRLVPLANYWNDKLGLEPPYPERHGDFLSQCHEARQERPTPLLLRYGAGDYNCLHRDLYGDILFPVQMAILLSEPGGDFTGGEFVLTEQRPRMQSRASVVPLRRGDAVIFSVNRRPVKGARGFYSVFTRHGVSEVRTGNRFTLGVIFHDAQ